MSIKPRRFGACADLEGEEAGLVPCQFKSQLVENQVVCDDAREQPHLTGENHLEMMV